MRFQSTTRESVNQHTAETRHDDVLGQYEWTHDTVRPEDPDGVWACPRCGERVPFDGYDRICWDGDRLTSCGPFEYDPRPEYRPAANPILVDFREDAASWALETEGECSTADAARETLSWFEEDYHALPEHIDHARKVLTRLAALS